MQLIPLRVEQASTDDHPALLALAKTSPYTRDFGHRMFSGEEMYARGWIRLARRGTRVVGFSSFRHKVRAPETKLYFLVVDPGERGRGVGRALLEDLEHHSPHAVVSLDCAMENPACGFYERLGYTREGSSLEGRGWRYVKRRADE